MGKWERDAYFYKDDNQNIVGEIADIEACLYRQDGTLYTDKYFIYDPSICERPCEYLEKNLSVEQIANLMFERNEAEIVVSSNDLLSIIEDLFLANKDKWRVTTEYPIKSILFRLSADQFENHTWTMRDSFVTLVGGEEKYEEWKKETFVISTKREGGFSVFVSDEDDRLYPSMHFGNIVLNYWE